MHLQNNNNTGEMLTRNEVNTALEGLSVGESLAFPIDALLLVRNYASQYGISTGRRYETRTNREPLQVIVTRRA